MIRSLRALATGRVSGAVVVVVLMWALGGVLGLVWERWSPPGPAGFLIAPGLVEPGESEAFVAGDGRFAVIALAVGIVAGLIVWFTRIGRGVPAVLVLALGGLGGAGATALVGHGVRGAGKHYSCGGGTATCIDHLPLAVHAHGLLLLEAAVAVLVYGLCVSFTRSDDLGMPDPIRERVLSVRADVQLQHPGGDGDAVSGAQQRDLPPQ